MLGQVGFGLAAGAILLATALLARRTGLPLPVLLVGAGILYALLPGPNVELDPEIILVLVIPPLLYAAALHSSLLGIRANLRVVTSLSVVLVIVTALTAGWMLALVVPGLGFAAACALTSALAPPDAVAALSIGRKLGLPSRLTTVIEGESLLNDATALTLYAVAVAAATGGGFSVPSAVGRFVLAAGGGVVVGYAVALPIMWVQRRIDEPNVVTTLSLATPFIAYVAAEEAHASGVLAVVVAGLWLGHHSPLLLSGASRFQTRSVWGLVEFLLEGAVFLLIGQQLPAVVRGLGNYPVSTVTSAAVVSVAAVVLIRPLWLLVPLKLPGRARCLTSDPALTGRELGALSWTGMRGVISLAAVFALPRTAAGEGFPYRDLLLFCAYIVVLVTLVGQGLTFGPVVRSLRLRPDADDVRRLRALARVAATDAGLRHLDDLAAVQSLPGDVVQRLRGVATERQRRSIDRLASADPESDDDEQDAASAAYDRIRREMIEVGREELLRWRDAGRLPDVSLRLLQRELDHEEGTLPVTPL